MRGHECIVVEGVFGVWEPDGWVWEGGLKVDLAAGLEYWRTDGRCVPRRRQAGRLTRTPWITHSHFALRGWWECLGR